MKRHTFLLLALFVLSLAACEGGDKEGEPFTEPVRPTITLNNGEVSVAGKLINICWPRGEGNISCEPTFDDTQPSDALLVSRDDTIAISTGVAELPDELVVTSPDFTQTFRRDESAQFPVVSLADGRNVLEVTAFYYDLAKSEAVVSMVFAVDVGVAAAFDVTPTTMVETPEATDDATGEATEQITATRRPSTPTRTATRVPPTVVDTQDETRAPTATATETDRTAAPTAVETEIVPTLTATRQLPTSTSIPPTPSPTATRTTVASPTNLPTSTPTAVVTTDAISFVGTAPLVTLSVVGREFSPAGVNFCRRTTNNQQVCVEQPTDTSMPRVPVGRGQSAIVEIEGDRPTSVAYRIIDFDTLQPLVGEERAGDNIVLLTIDLPANVYLLAIEVVWPEMSGTYFFQIRVQE